MVRVRSTPVADAARSVAVTAVSSTYARTQPTKPQVRVPRGAMDDLLDLDFTSASSPASGPSGSTSRPPYSTGGLSTFDYLSQARTSPAPSSRAGSPYSTPPVSQPGSKAAAGGGRGGGGGDAFSSLFGGGASVKGPEEELSIAERIARDRGQSRAANANANGHGATT